MSGHGQMSGRMHGRPMSGQDMGANSQEEAARMDAWRRWHERMGQQRWQDDRGGDYSAGPEWMDRGRGSGEYERNRWSQDDYYDYSDRGPGYQGRGRDRNAMGYDDQRRWRRDPRDQSYFPDYYSDRDDWRGPRYDRRLEEGSGYTFRDDPYYRDRGWGGPRYGRGGPGYYGDYCAERDWGYRDRGDWRGGRWHGERWGEGSAERYDRYPQSRGQGMGDMTGRGWDYPDYYQGERGGPMTGERWDRWQGSQWNDEPQWRSGMDGQRQYPSRGQRGQAGAGSDQTGSASGGSSATGAAAGQPGAGTSGESGSSGGSTGSSR